MTFIMGRAKNGPPANLSFRRSTDFVNFFTVSAATKLVDFYQLRISPYKGYSCAYRVLHDDVSCSQYCKLQIEERGILLGIMNMFDRFRLCAQASRTLRTDKPKKRKGQNGRLADEDCGPLSYCEVALCLPDSCTFAAGASDLADAACCLFSGI